MSDQYQTAEQRVSYGIGRQMGEQILENPFEGLEIEAVLSGLADSLNHVEMPITEEDMEAAFEQVRERIKAQHAAAGAGQSAEGEAFLADNAKREGVTITASGLQYEILTEGDGSKPSSASTVRTHYHGTLIDGTVFDSSYERGEPAEFPVNGVIAGWTEALQMMGVGSKWRLFLPHELAYGERGAGGDIRPYAALVFDVELLDILD
jgi:FKBP-type peptidyl-prolyl cis-trans isomerase FklB